MNTDKPPTLLDVICTDDGRTDNKPNLPFPFTPSEDYDLCFIISDQIDEDLPCGGIPDIRCPVLIAAIVSRVVTKYPYFITRVSLEYIEASVKEILKNCYD